MSHIFAETRQVVAGVPSFKGEFVFTSDVLYYVAQACLERKSDRLVTLGAVLGGGVGRLFGGLLGQAVGSAKIEGPVEPGMSERGIVPGIEDTDDLGMRLDKLILDSRDSGFHTRRDLARPQRYDRHDVSAAVWKQEQRTLAFMTRYDELEFVFEAKYRNSPAEAAREFAWI